MVLWRRIVSGFFTICLAFVIFPFVDSSVELKASTHDESSGGDSDFLTVVVGSSLMQTSSSANVVEVRRLKRPKNNKAAKKKKKKKDEKETQTASHPTTDGLAKFGTVGGLTPYGNANALAHYGTMCHRWDVSPVSLRCMFLWRGRGRRTVRRLQTLSSTVRTGDQQRIVLRIWQRNRWQARMYRFAPIPVPAAELMDTITHQLFLRKDNRFLFDGMSKNYKFWHDAFFYVSRIQILSIVLEGSEPIWYITMLPHPTS